MNYKPMDTEAKALAGRIKHHLGHNYLNQENCSQNLSEMHNEFERLKKIPVREFSITVWDDLAELAEQALL